MNDNSTTNSPQTDNKLLKESDYYRLGNNEFPDDNNYSDDKKDHKKIIEPWLSAIFQSEHLSLLVGNGLTTAVNSKGNNKGKNVEVEVGTENEKGSKDIMRKIDWKSKLYKDKPLEYAEKINEYVSKTAQDSANFEDSIRAALQLIEGLTVMQENDKAVEWKNAVKTELNKIITEIIKYENKISEDKEKINLLVRFLLSLSNRPARQDRLNIFTTNYDRVIEYGCDRAGIRIIDRFIGSISPIFNATRMNIDVHYNPPGIKGEPRYLQGVIRLTKLHGSLDWQWVNNEIKRVPLGFGDEHTKDSKDAAIIYPNPAKDLDSTNYPYSELFRDFAAAICRPNSSLVIYGYSFGDEHINRIIKDMLNISSTHLLIIYWGNKGDRKKVINFLDDVIAQEQVSLIFGEHFADIENLVNYYLPKPALEEIRIRQNIINNSRLKEQSQNNDTTKQGTPSNNQ